MRALKTPVAPSLPVLLLNHWVISCFFLRFHQRRSLRGNFGASGVKVSNLNLGTKVGSLQPYLLGLRIRTSPAKWRGLIITKQLDKPVIGCKCLSDSGCVTKSEDSSKEAKSYLTTSGIPNLCEVESLLTRICDTSSIVEFELKLGGFRLFVSKNLKGQCNPPPTLVSAPDTLDTIVKAPDQSESISTLSLAIARSVPSSVGIQTFLDKVADEGLMILQSPKVGYFRRSRSMKGKRAPPSCKESQLVKEGQVLCYVEQFGGEVPIESDVSGEVVKILREDGDPVGYDDALIAVLPSFPGIKQLN